PGAKGAARGACPADRPSAVLPNSCWPGHAGRLSTTCAIGRPRPIVMKEIPELDSVRGLAAAGIVLYHAFPFVFFLGWSCVDLFFVLSGYLITTIIIEHHRAPGFLRAFYARRALRIWPVYFLVLAGCLVMNRLSRQGYPAGTLGTVQHLTFTQNIQGIWGGSVPAYVYAIGPSWSVAIEEQFYLLWPLLLVAMGRRAVLPAAF